MGAFSAPAPLQILSFLPRRQPKQMVHIEIQVAKQEIHDGGMLYLHR